MKYLMVLAVWFVSSFLQVNIFKIEHDANVMLYGATTLAVMVLVLTLMSKEK